MALSSCQPVGPPPSSFWLPPPLGPGSGPSSVLSSGLPPPFLSGEIPHSGPRSLSPPGQTRHRACSPSALSRLLWSALLCSQGIGGVAPCSGPIFAQSVPHSDLFPHGDSGLRPPHRPSSRLGDLHRSGRRLLPYSHSPFFPEVAPFFPSQPGLSVQGPSVRSLSRSMGLHESDSRLCRSSSPTGPSPLGLSGRLAPPRLVTGPLSPADSARSATGPLLGIPPQLPQVGASSIPNVHLPGDVLSDGSLLSPPILGTAGPSSLPLRFLPGHSRFRPPPGCSLGCDGVAGSSSPSRSPSQTPVPEGIPSPLVSDLRGLGRPSSSPPVVPRLGASVAEHPLASPGCSPDFTCTGGYSLHRCLPPGVGCTRGGSHVGRLLVPFPSELPYQYAGAPRRPSCRACLRCCPLRQARFTVYGQHHGCLLREQAGGGHVRPRSRGRRRISFFTASHVRSPSLHGMYPESSTSWPMPSAAPTRCSPQNGPSRTEFCVLCGSGGSGQ